MSARKPNFAAAALPFIKQAKIPPSDLLPLVPPGATVAAESSVKPFQLGKIPGRYAHGEWWGLAGHWPTAGLSEADQAKAQNWPTDNVGLRAADWPAVDCDVATEEAQQMVDALVERHLGFAPMRLRSNASRALYVFRKSGDDAVRKMRLVFSDGVHEHAVEVLGAGQQYVIAGIHPSGAPYYWKEGRELVRVGADGLTRMDAIGFAKFMDALRVEIDQRGWVVKTQTQARGGLGGISFDVDKLEPVAEPELALAALNAIPNDVANVPLREQFVSLCASFKATLGKRAEECREQFLDWATKYDFPDRDWAAQIWDTVTTVRTGPDHLFGMARKHGFLGDALADFSDPVVIKGEAAQDADKAETEDDILRKVADQLVYWAQELKFLHLGTLEELSHAALNSYSGLGTLLAPSGTSGTKSAANRLINSGLVKNVKGKTYLPNQPTLTTWVQNGVSGLYFNSWSANEPWPLPAHVTNQDVQPWLDHLVYLFPDADDRRDMIDWMAHLVQKRGTKIRWAPLVISKQGVGKDSMLKPVFRWLGDNAQELSPEALGDRFNNYLENELLIVQEMNRMDRFDAYERIKALISGTASDLVRVEEKFKATYNIPNVCNLIFFTNHADAIAMSPDDRRFLVLMVEAERREEEYYTKLHAFYDTDQGMAKVIQWLMQRDLSAFNPAGRPRLTAAKQEVIGSAQPIYFDTFREQVEQGVFAKFDILTVADVVLEAQSNFNLPPAFRQAMTTKHKASKALQAAGWHNTAKQVRVRGEVTRFWVRKPELCKLAVSDLRDKYELERKQETAL
jgi:hypothetical protein